MDYSASYTAGGILYEEFEAILPIIENEDRAKLLANEIKQNHFLKINSESARKRVIAEINKRIRSIDAGFWKYYQSCAPDEKRLLLFYLCVKTYLLIRDFHFKVTFPAYWAYRYQVDMFAYKMYLDELGSKNETVNGWTESTRNKCISNYTKMLKDAGLLKNNSLQHPKIEYSFFCYFIKQNEHWALDIFLLNNQDKENIINYCK